MNDKSVFIFGHFVRLCFIKFENYNKNKCTNSSLNNLKILNLHNHRSCQIHKSTRQPNR